MRQIFSFERSETLMIFQTNFASHEILTRRGINPIKLFSFLKFYSHNQLHFLHIE